MSGVGGGLSSKEEVPSDGDVFGVGWEQVAGGWGGARDCCGGNAQPWEVGWLLPLRQLWGATVFR